MPCPSVYIALNHDKLVLHPCRLPANHTGRCSSGTGYQWTRVAEWLRLDREHTLAAEAKAALPTS